MDSSRWGSLARRGLPVGVVAADDPVVAAEALAKFALCGFELVLDDGPERGSDVGGCFWRRDTAEVAVGGFQDGVGGHVIVVIVFVIGIGFGGLRAVVRVI